MQAARGLFEFHSSYGETVLEVITGIKWLINNHPPNYSDGMN